MVLFMDKWSKELEWEFMADPLANCTLWRRRKRVHQHPSFTRGRWNLLAKSSGKLGKKLLDTFYTDYCKMWDAFVSSLKNPWVVKRDTTQQVTWGYSFTCDVQKKIPFPFSWVNVKLPHFLFSQQKPLNSYKCQTRDHSFSHFID